MIKRAFAISSILIIVLAAFVLAAGSSTSSRNTTNNRNTNSTNAICEDIATLRERIKCRLENPGKAYGTEEACRGLASQQACERLYNRSKSCYEQDSATAKKRCFLRESGINFNAGGTFRAAPKEAKQNYVVLLLYELQERIEKMQEENKITTEQATSLIAKIVEIKKMILSQSPRNEIVVKINEFKREYKSVVLGIGGRGNVGNSTTYNITNGTIYNVTNST